MCGRKSSQVLLREPRTNSSDTEAVRQKCSEPGLCKLLLLTLNYYKTTWFFFLITSRICFPKFIFGHTSYVQDILLTLYSGITVHGFKRPYDMSGIKPGWLCARIVLTLYSLWCSSPKDYIDKRHFHL